MLRRHDRWVRGVVYGVLGSNDLIDDVVQQVWTTVWEKIADLRDTSRWRVWLYRLARNAAVDAGRNVTKHRERTCALPAQMVDADGTDPQKPTVHARSARQYKPPSNRFRRCTANR
ncbi:MAG: sigma-70 family RNA polymerase sigma factor [Phycisphaerae bacterium]